MSSATRRSILDAIANTDLKFSAVCWGSHNGDLVSEDVSEAEERCGRPEEGAGIGR